MRYEVSTRNPYTKSSSIIETKEFRKPKSPMLNAELKESSPRPTPDDFSPTLIPPDRSPAISSSKRASALLD